MKKNNKKIKIIIVLMLLILTTGCTKVLTDSKNKPVKKRRRFRIKIGYIFAAIILIAVMVLIVKMVLPGNGINKYGDRLEGIKDVKFAKDDQKKIVEGILKNET